MDANDFSKLSEEELKEINGGMVADKDNTEDPLRILRVLKE